ncbi:uncharacterized protein BO97DRAFT_445307 [Aspergillus homomorphus CBS 101889]|uniref:DUF7708 domain-containing protein n=1 Tax=Aspergillus homomorphus (strain CBS 101889) TaxID=1450537 RepID=A0A395HQ40_ASPHC|nr:hypothetical protein BO97DRAFT_445307 [Aspergillus homomorphus CBS 101889]RAL09609.1 hypothetical protein BO97DRAFT_445307 [Aspergillus homomorphus CBS 101889]
MSISKSDWISSASARAFAGQLNPTSELDIQTKAYPESLTHEADANDRRRMNGIYYDLAPEEGEVYHGAEIARKALQAKCDEFFAAQEDRAPKTSPSRFRRHRKSGSRQLVGVEIKDAELYTVEHVKALAQQTRDKWMDGTGKISRNFNTICNNLDAHRAIFECFPSENVYTSVLCSAVSMIIQASVNYSTIAEQLSSHINTLSDRILVCTRWVDTFDEPIMQARLSSIYGAFFDFFTEVAAWYLKPWYSRVVDSFNSHCAPKYQATVSSIERSLDLMTEYGVTLIADGVLKLSRSAAYVREAMTKWRTEFKEVETFRKELGQYMYTLLETTAAQENHVRQLEQLHHPQAPTPAPQPPSIPAATPEENNPTPCTPQTVSRAEAAQYCTDLETFIHAVGASDGIDLATDTPFIRLDAVLVRRLGAWLQSSEQSSCETLWISSPHERGERTSADWAAIKVIQVAIRAKGPFISHVGRRPHPSEIAAGFSGTPGEAGLLAMVYSLILQLLQFRPEEDAVQLPLDMLVAMSECREDGAGWRAALEVFRMLLAGTPVLGYCIVSGLVEMEADAEERCRAFLDVLLGHAPLGLRVLLATSGRSALLPGYVGVEGQLRTDRSAHAMGGMGRVGGLF